MQDMAAEPATGGQRGRRVVMIGPALPYRGGIARHTTMLHRALREQADCLTISFSRQYPRRLFPGKNDKDEVLAGHEEAGVEFIIDSINPLTWIRAVKRIRQFAPDVVIFPWWHVYWTLCFTWISRQLKKDAIEIVFFCHNITEHEDAHWKHLLTGIALSHANRFVVQTSVDYEHIVNRFPDRPVDVHPHPINVQFPKPAAVLPRRAKRELLFFGFVRPYKGLEVLLEAMVQLKDKDVFLSVVGEFWKGESDIKKYIIDEGLERKVEVIPRYVSDGEAATFFSRCDVVILPYYSATGSGVVALSYYYGKPVIATRVGGLPAVVDEGKTGVLIEPGSSTELAAAIKKALQDRDFFSAEGIETMKARLTWDRLAKVCLGSSNEWNKRAG
jgi:glycosyltransferase involved in cell wall biosynthesis